jgi:predicted P-loop ATPase
VGVFLYLKRTQQLFNRASYFLEHGLAVFECKQDKRPKLAGWRDLEYWHVDADEADVWKCYGIALDSNWLVVDVDLKKPEAHDSFQRLSTIVDFEGTFKVKTANGGWHYWLKNPTQQAIRKNLHEYSGIDFLSVGCYVVGPGSRIATGTYAYTDGDLETTPEANAELLRLLFKDTSRNVGYGSQIDKKMENSANEIIRFKQWLTHQPPAILGQKGDDNTYKIAAQGYDFGLTPEEILDSMLEWNERCVPPWSKEELATRVRNADKYKQNAPGKAISNFNTFNDVTTEGLQGYVQQTYDEDLYESLHPNCGMTYRGEHILPSITNLRLILLSERYRGLFMWDLFRSKIYLTHMPPWRSNKKNLDMRMSDTDYTELKMDIAINARLDATSQLLDEGVLAIALARSFHPICDWLNSLSWDGTPRLHRIFGSGPYKMQIAKIFLLASVYRIFYPGYKFDHMLVIAGKQGLQKSLLIQKLGGEFTKTLSSMPTDRKGLQELEGAWWIELPEITAVNKVDINAVKAFITTTLDTYIPMYGRHGVQDYPRVAIPVWTLNPTDAGFIVDDENRRFLIVEQKEVIDCDYIEKNRDQIFAEVMELYRQGVKPHVLVQAIKVTAEEIAQANRTNDEDPWELSIKLWLIGKEDQKIYTRDIFTDVLCSHRVGDWDKKSQMRIARVLKKLGWKKSRDANTTFFVKINDSEVDWDIEI